MKDRNDWSVIEGAVRERMRSRNMQDAVIAEIVRRVRLVYEGESGRVDWNTIGDLRPEDTIDLETLGDEGASRETLKGLAIIKLNGGLGTTMGLSVPKSVIEVKPGLNFLEIMKLQVEHLRKTHSIETPLLFMNSFYTRDDTLAHPGIRSLNENCPGKLPADFLQNMAPRLLRDSLLPLGDGSQDSHWCPPGHGDVFLALFTTGLLDRLIENGYRVAFLSNGDNLGATADPNILRYFLSEGLEFASEVTPKTRADLKGGVLYRRRGPEGEVGPIELLETAQVPDEHLSDFQDVNRFAYFNINNLWVNLEALRERLRRGSLELSLIVNPKEVDGTPVLQLETAMGAAIGRFDRTRVIIVPRRRFAPVKNCADLLVRRSDAYTLESDYRLEMNPTRKLSEPVVILDDRFYKKLPDFEKRFLEAPSLVAASSFEVRGPVIFDRPVKISGQVCLENPDATDRLVSELSRDAFQDETIAFP